MKAFFISFLNMIPGLMAVLNKLSQAINRVSTLFKAILDKLDFISRKVMFLVWVVTVLWFTFKPVNVDADLQAVKQQCADLKDVVQITGGSVDEKGPSEAHYYFSCAVRAGTQSHAVAQPVIPDPMNMFGAMTSPETK